MLCYVKQINLENDDKDYKNNHENIEIETVFVCETCKRDFNDRASLWLHIRAMHKEYAAFTCGVCLKMCFNNTQLQNHVYLYHGRSKLSISEQRRYSRILYRLFSFHAIFMNLHHIVYYITFRILYNKTSSCEIHKYLLYKV